MSALTKNLQDKFHEAAMLKKNLSAESKVVFDFSILLIADICEANQKNRVILEKRLSESRKNLTLLTKKEPTMKSLILQLTKKPETSTAPALIKGLEAWIKLLISPEITLKKHNKLK